MGMRTTSATTIVTALAFAASLFAVLAILTEANLARAEDKAMAAIEAAVENPARGDEDRARDAGRMPGEILGFFGIEPGMTVLDLNSGGGYYTEIVSYVVGADGKVYGHNDEIYWPFVEQSNGPAYKDKGLANVEQINGVPVEDLAIEAGSVDAAIMILAFHDWYFTPEGREDPADVPAALAKVKEILKPGGTFGIVDHVAPAGSPAETGNTTHRIDPALVTKLMLDAGFVLAGETDILRNPEDPGTGSPFAEGLRGRTDRFVFQFRKPQ